MNSNTFTSLGLGKPLVTTLKRLGFTEPTEVQSQVIPSAIAGKNIIASAETGSGKTAAFLLPIIERLKQPERLRALVLAPTRELAVQIDTNARAFNRTAGLRTACVVGGESLNRQVRAIKAGVDMVIATPGRLLDLIDRREIALGNIEVLVLDEADRMVDMGFLPQVRQIIKHLPAKRQTLLLTATLSKAVEQLARDTMTDCLRFEAERSATTVATLSQKAFPVLAHAKAPLLLALLKQHREDSFVIFTQTRRGADRLAHVLAANKHEVVTLHSDRTQSQRHKALASFRAGRARVLVATDVAARGIDVDDIAFVVNYEVPATPEDYIHRVGRTARAGRDGSALTLVSPEEEPQLASIKRVTGITLERSKVNGFTDGRSEEQIRLASEIARLRGSSRHSYGRSRASR